MPDSLEENANAHAWLSRAKSNLSLAKTTKNKDTYWEDLCFNAQQAAEKAIKAVLQFNQIPFRFTHDLEELITTLSKHQVPFPKELNDVVTLTEYAVETRYPGVYEQVTEDEYQIAIMLAEAVIQWADQILKK